ncbi:MAG TPA: methionyl-tRNA formyltransferase [Blastocatellia bacterium]|jgi:methionyl-tRNA formyltransferase|nr:methionyl-tRNA formyltransferase [Blastocatellia bacterium]
MKLIFMGTPEFAVPSLARLLRDGHEVTAVFTQPDKPAGRGKNLQAPPVKSFAIGRGLAVHQPGKIKANEEARATFNAVAPDACVVAAYGKILPEWMLAIPRLGCINVHASLLPKYRGAAPINWAIANGERETGVTIMQMDAGLDTGDMLSSRAIEIGSEETAPELSARLSELGAELLSETLSRLERGELGPTPQDDTQATHAPILRREDGLIDWRMSAREIANRVRAFQPWPGTYTFFRGARLTVWRARETAAGQSSQPYKDEVDPATILAIDKSGMVIACADSTSLRVEELQVEGKRRLSGREFINGMRLSVGDRITEGGGQ